MNKNHQTEIELANRFQLKDLKSGVHIIRDENGFRDNEIKIDYILLISIDRAFSGTGGILLIKQESRKFRNYENREKLVKLVFTTDETGKLGSTYQEDEYENFTDLIPAFKRVDLLDANRGMTLDGIIYQIYLDTVNIQTRIEVNNPNHESWKKLESEFWRMGVNLVEKSEDEKLLRLFE